MLNSLQHPGPEGMGPESSSGWRNCSRASSSVR